MTTNLKPRRVTFNTINAELARLGHPEQLVKGNGYFYFVGGDASKWPTCSVYTYHLTSLSLEEWIGEHAALSTAQW